MSTPTTFEAHGHTWTKHTPGDPMPCEPDTKLHVLLRDGKPGGRKGKTDVRPALEWDWSILNFFRTCEIIGWRYATPPQEKDELARLREEMTELTRKGEQVTHELGVSMMENASMRTAIKAIYDATECYADGAEDATSHDKLANEIANLAKPFTESK